MTEALYAFLVALTLLVPAHNSQPVQGAPVPVPEASVAIPAGWQQDMLIQVNALRARAHADPLTLCPRLTAYAEKHATRMADTGLLEHSNPAAYGENIAGGQGTVTQVMGDWQTSPAHMGTLVNPAYTCAGFAVAQNPDTAYVIYWAQEFR